MNSTAGRWKIARATINRCAIPPESANTDALAHFVRWNCASSSSEIRLESAEPIPNSRPWKYRFSHTVSWRSSVFCCETTPISCFASAGWEITSIAATWAPPRVGTTRVVSIPAVVVLPAPWAEQPEDLARRHLQVEAVDGGEVGAGVHLRQAIGADDRRRGHGRIIPMDLGLRDRACIVTGASRGIGRATALLLAGDGASLLLVGRQPEPLEEPRATAWPPGARRDAGVDVTDAGAGERVARGAWMRSGGSTRLSTTPARAAPWRSSG